MQILTILAILACGEKEEPEDTDTNIDTDTNVDTDTDTSEPENQAPSCEIGTPDPSAPALEGTEVLFNATVSDPDEPAENLSIQWLSDQDGVLGNLAADSSGNASFSTATLSVNEHQISIIVTDSEGENCSAELSYRVGAAPLVEFDIPADPIQVNEGENISFSAVVSDADHSPEEVSLSWESSIDGVFSTNSADSNGEAGVVMSTLSIGSHTITVIATDPDGFSSQSSLEVLINGIPSQPSITISPDPAYSSDDLIAIASGSADPEGENITYSYDWLLNGTSSGYTGDTLPSSATQKSETWTVQATPLMASQQEPLEKHPSRLQIPFLSFSLFLSHQLLREHRMI